MNRTQISFYEQFAASICSGAKTLTLRDSSCADVAAGDLLDAVAVPSARVFARLRVTQIEAVTFDALTGQHAERENMTLAELRAVVRKIYPRIDMLIAIDFELVPAEMPT